jgi:multicomponent Na+:H+ antiporter subunit C
MTLTALIIGFAVTALLLAMVHRVYTTHRSVDLDDLARSERTVEEELERGVPVEQDEAEAEAESDPEAEVSR